MLEKSTRKAGLEVCGWLLCGVFNSGKKLMVCECNTGFIYPSFFVYRLPQQLDDFIGLLTLEVRESKQKYIYTSAADLGILRGA